VGAWPVLWAFCGRRGGVAGHLGPVWPPWGRGRSPGPRVAAVGAWPVLWAPCGAVGAWPVLWAPYGRRGGVACPLALSSTRLAELDTVDHDVRNGPTNQLGAYRSRCPELSVAESVLVIQLKRSTALIGLCRFSRRKGFR